MEIDKVIRQVADWKNIKAEEQGTKKIKWQGAGINK